MKIYKNFLTETKQEKTAVATFGRMNPPSIGHVKLAKKILSEAKKHRGEPYICLSPTQNAKKDPLGPERKLYYVEKTIGPHIHIDVKPTVFEALSDLYSKGFKKLVFVVGSDRLSKFSKWISQYNGVEGKAHGFYDFTDIDFVSSGDRDPDAEGAAGMSASKLREFAVSGDIDSFKKGTKLSVKDTKSMYNEIRKAMKIDTIKESALRPGTKVKVAHPAKGKGMVTGKIVRYDNQGPGSPFYIVDIGEYRSEKVPAHKIREGAEYPKTPTAKKAHIAKLMKRVKDTQAKREKSMGVKIIDRTPDWMFPKEEVEVDEMSAVQKTALNIHNQRVKLGIVKPGTKKIKKKESGVQKAARSAGMSGAERSYLYNDNHLEDIEIDEAKIEKQPDDHLRAKMKQLRTSGKTDMPSSQFMIKRIGKEMKKRGLEEKAPPGREKQVKALKKKVGTEQAYAFAWAQHNKHGLPEESVEEEIKHKSDVVLHPASKKSGWVAKSVKSYKKQMKKPSHPGYGTEESVVTDKLKLKAEQSGVPVKILQKVYSRGISAWGASHRPGTTPQQWAESRVNSFLTGGKTRLIADQDLWIQVNSEHRTKEEMDTNHAFKKWLAFSEGDVVVDTPQGRYVKKGSVASEKMRAKRAFRDQKDKKAVSTRVASPIERKYLQRKDEG